MHLVSRLNVASSSWKRHRSTPPKRPSKNGDGLLDGVAVLVVEDDPASQKLTALLLVAEGAEVKIAGSAEQAIAMLESTSNGNGNGDAGFMPRVIVLDIVLPRMSGLVFMEHLKKDPRLSSIVIVAVSAMNGAELERMATRAGCAAYLIKPISTESFAETIAWALGQQQDQEDRRGDK